MLTVSLLLSAISAFSAAPTISFADVVADAPAEEISYFAENNILDWDDYELHLQQNPVLLAQGSNGNGDSSDSPSASLAISNLSTHLSRYFSSYIWFRNASKSSETSKVTGHVPINVQDDSYFEEELQAAIARANLEETTNYGGCGPIAAIGALDYFARYLGYTEIIDDVMDSEKRISLATEVMSNTHYSIFGSEDSSTVWPKDYVKAFNAVAKDRGLSIRASNKTSLLGGRETEFWSDIVDSINNGLPVTMFTGPASGDGSFANHYTTVFGYETWAGIPREGGSRIEKTFLKANLNYSETDACYCDSKILNYIYSGIITYNLHYDASYSFSASDFAEEFVNDSGGGQYFYSPVNQSVSLTNGMALQTTRLRTSYIENQYLVMSPKRQDAGAAYLDIAFPTKVSRISFDASIWSLKEDINDEEFKIQYYDNGWHDHLQMDLDALNLKENPDRYVALFPKDTTRIRFYATHSNPTGDRNKGRICLDNFEVRYNATQVEA